MKNVTTITLVCVASALTAFAQQNNTNTTPAAPKPYVRPWKGLELKAHECFTDAEDFEHHRVFIEAVKTPEVVAAAKAEEDAKKAAMLKADPTLAPVLEKIATARKTMRISAAIATLTPEEKAQYDKAFGVALRSPEVQAANQAATEIRNAMMIKINPACAEFNKRLAAAMEAARKDFYSKEKPAEHKADPKPAAPQ